METLTENLAALPDEIGLCARLASIQLGEVTVKQKLCLKLQFVTKQSLAVF